MGLRWLRGYVYLHITGTSGIEVLRKLAQHHLVVWNIQMRHIHPATGNQQVDLAIQLQDIPNMRKLLRGMKCRVRFGKREGFPFYLDKLKRRKWFVIAALCCFLAIAVYSSLIWEISVEGNERIPTEEILQVAMQKGMYRFQWKFRLSTPDQLAREVQLELPYSSWVGITIRGTHLYIRVVESVVQEQKKLENTCHLIAHSDALVTQIIAYQGKAIVEPQTYVKQGDILISGTIGEETQRKEVVAKGIVKGIVWYNITIESPLHRIYDVQTGQQSKRYYLVLGQYAVRLFGSKQLPYSTYVTQPIHHKFKWRNIQFPISWLRETIRETDRFEQKFEVQEAKQIGLQFAKQRLLRQLDEEATVMSENILHEKTENGKVYINVLIEVEQSIAQIQPIVSQGD